MNISPTSPGMPGAAVRDLSNDHSAGDVHLTPAVVSNADTYVGPSSRQRPPFQTVPMRETESADLGWRYRLEQYGTDALVVSGAALAFTLLVTPEPIVTKIIGGLIALACILGGLAAKHSLFKRAYAARALEQAVGRLGQRIDQLSGDVAGLEKTRNQLQETNVSLVTSREKFSGQVDALKAQIGRLKTEVNDAFVELNKDRSAFEEHRRQKLNQLNDEIAEANARGDDVERKQSQLDARELELDALAKELAARRENLVVAEAKLQDMQAKLLRSIAGR